MKQLPHNHTAPESNIQDPQGRTLDLPIFFRSKHRASLKNHLSLAQGEGLPYWLGATFAAVFVLVYSLREFLCLLSLIALK